MDKFCDIGSEGRLNFREGVEGCDPVVLFGVD